MDGYDEPVTLRAALTVGDDRIHVDYAGTSPVSSHGINVVLNYTKAYTCFGVKCAVAPDIPNNYGSLLPITFFGAGGVHPERAAAVRGRGAAHHRPPASGYGAGMPAPGSAGRRAGGRVGVFVEHPAAGRAVGVSRPRVLR